METPWKRLTDRIRTNILNLVNVPEHTGSDMPEIQSILSNITGLAKSAFMKHRSERGIELKEETPLSVMYSDSPNDKRQTTPPQKKSSSSNNQQESSKSNGQQPTKKDGSAIRRYGSTDSFSSSGSETGSINMDAFDYDISNIPLPVTPFSSSYGKNSPYLDGPFNNATIDYRMETGLETTPYGENQEEWSLRVRTNKNNYATLRYKRFNNRYYVITHFYGRNPYKTGPIDIINPITNPACRHAFEEHDFYRKRNLPRYTVSRKSPDHHRKWKEYLQACYNAKMFIGLRENGTSTKRSNFLNRIVPCYTPDCTPFYYDPKTNTLIHDEDLPWVATQFRQDECEKTLSFDDDVVAVQSEKAWIAMMKRPMLPLFNHNGQQVTDQGEWNALRSLRIIYDKPVETHPQWKAFSQLIWARKRALDFGLRFFEMSITIGYNMNLFDFNYFVQFFVNEFTPIEQQMYHHLFQTVEKPTFQGYPLRKP